MTNRKIIRSATAVAAMGVALSLTACVGSTPEGRDQAKEQKADRQEAVDEARDKVDEIKEDPTGAIAHAGDQALRLHDQKNYEAYTWLRPGDALMVEDEEGHRYDVSLDKFRTIDLTDGGDVVADLGCYDFTAAVVGKADEAEDAALHRMEGTFFGDYTSTASTRPFLTMLMDDGEDPSPFYGDPQGSLGDAGYTLTLPTSASGSVDVAKATNVISPASAGSGTADEEDDTGGDPGVSGLDEWRGQWGFGKDRDADTGADTAQDEEETRETYPAPAGDVGHDPLSITQTRCVVISGGVPGDGQSSAVNAGGGEEVEPRSPHVTGWLAWWRGSAGAPKVEDGPSYGGWSFPLEPETETDEKK
ncbi:hypothetical protein [Corynebacterium nuruki]|uniref:hypothetical protein n=1 Tax=Corynebacterium nuruki TaxID=1032851 RepID=UPI0039BFCB89